MQINHNDLPCCDALICDQIFRADDDTSCYAIFNLASCSCGVTIEAGSGAPWLRLCPGIQIPPCAREGFGRFQFKHPDESMVDLRIDTKDGEITLRRDLPGLDPADVEPVLHETLTWLDTTACPAIVNYVRTSCRS